MKEGQQDLFDAAHRLAGRSGMKGAGCLVTGVRLFED